MRAGEDLTATDQVAAGEVMATSSHLVPHVRVVGALTTTMTEQAHLEGEAVAEAELTVVTSSRLEAMVTLVVPQRRRQQNVRI